MTLSQGVLVSGWLPLGHCPTEPVLLTAQKHRCARFGTVQFLDFLFSWLPV